ncbi:hypothetical protein ABIB40_003677 [Pedobacter sp. UYP30]|uniref:hypothetical protein n=1 Tax=Pedobacter sp. UYP30 TaxID=1756400 RepID=UPI003394242E
MFNKILILLLFTFLAVSCQQNQHFLKVDKNVQVVVKTHQRIRNNAHENANSMRYFDIDSYEKKMIKNQFYDGRELADGSYLQEYFIPKDNVDTDPFNRNSVKFYVEKIEKTDGFVEMFVYYSSGRLKEYNLFFPIELQTGVWKEFDQHGNLTKSIDKDKDYEYTLQNVIDFGKMKNIDFHKEGDLDRGYDEEFKKNVWNVSWIVDVPSQESTQEVYILDGNTGVVLKHKTQDAPILSN